MAVYTDVGDEDLAAFIADYDIGELVSFKGIAEGVENSNFLLRTTAASFILTLYEKRVNEAELPFFIGLMQHLAGRGINCPTPVRARSGAALGRLAGRPAAIVTFLDGVSVRRPRLPHCAQLGVALADLHAAGADFAVHRTNALSLPGWRPLFERSADRADEVQPGLAAEIDAELGRLEAEWPKALPAGVIHADLFPDNVFFLGDDLSGLIDFYFACNDFLAYDLVICLNAWCFETDLQFNVTKARALIAGYESRRPLTPGERAALPLLARGAAMRFLLSRLYDWLNVPPGALVTPKDPIEYLRKLRFHQRVTGVGAYGMTP
ncbi:homoserine kinase [Methylobrevis albus]|uniref:Homoserine kinase n=1 Tax=Methylobrevis albus TaxID=2793297 RepID=A0A931I1B1_9HYPH|nr:homoserine kinase [Methylobrevis albus]MBH0237141.1 homoserine kinase [Methylobrevis albus]